MKPRRSFLPLFGSSQILSASVVFAAWVTTGQLRAVDIYWDSDGATSGGSSGTTATGNWGTSAFWSTDAAGASATTATWTGTNTAVFSAGTDVTGSSTVTLNANTSAAGLKFEEGAVSLVSATSAKTLSLGAGGITIYNGTPASGVPTLGGTTAATALVLSLTANQTWTNNITGAALLRSGVTTASNSSLTLQGNFDFRASGSVTPALTLGTGSLIQTGGSVEYGSGTGTNGGFFLKSGLAFVRSAAAVGTGTITLGDSTGTPSSTFRATSVTIANPVVLGTNGTIVLNNLGAATAPNFTGGITGINSVTLQSVIGGAGTSNPTFSSVSSSSINHTGDLVLQNAGNATAAGAIGIITVTTGIGANVNNVTISNVTTADVGITQGSQSVVFGTTAKNHSGTTTVNSGARLELSSTQVLPDGTGKGNVVINGTLDLRGGAETINGLSGSGTITRSTSGSSTLTVGANNVTSTFSGVIQNGSGTVALTKTGSGTLTLSGSSGYSGTTSVSAGILVLSHNNAAGTSALNVGSATAGTLLSEGAVTIANSIQMSANPSSGTHTLGGNSDDTSTFSGPILIAGNALISQVGTTGGNALNLTGGIGANNPGTYTLTFAGPGKINVSTTPITNGTIGTVAVKVTGGDTTFSTANTYTGSTTVQGGTLTLQNDSSLNDLSTVEVSVGATLVLDFLGTDTIERLTFDGIPQATGTWGKPGSGADHTDSRISGDGLLLVAPRTFTWTDLSGDENWATALNWDVNTVPNALSTLQFPAAADTSLINDLAPGSSVTRLLFLSDAPAYTINGTNSLILTTGITNTSANEQILEFPIEMASTGAFPMSVGTAGLVLNGNLSGTVGLSKFGTGTLKLAGLNSYSGTTSISAGGIWATGASSLPSATTVAFTNTTGTASLDITGLTQTLAGLTFGTQTTGSNQVSILGDSSTSLTVSPSSLIFAPANTASNLTVNLSGVESFTYDNPSGTFSVNGGIQASASNTHFTTVSLAGGSNHLAAASFNVGNIGGLSGVHTSTLNLGTNANVFANAIGVGSSGVTGSRASATLNAGSGTLKIRGSSGASSAASLVIGRSDSTTVTDVTNSVLNASPGTLDAIFDSVVIGLDAAGGAARGVTINASLKMGAGSLTANSMSIGNLSGAYTGAGSYAINGLLDLNGIGTARISTLKLADNTASTSPPAFVLSSQVNLNGGATLEATTIQRGTVTGVSTLTARINWTDGTIRNIPGGDLSISGIGLVLASGSHTFDVSSGQSASVSSIISGNGTLTKSGSGILTLSGANTYLGPTIVSAGMLETTSTFLDDTSVVEITSGAKLNLNFSGTDKVDALTLDGIPQTSGTTYGATGSGAAVIDDVHFSGTGKLQVGVIADPYLGWAASPTFGLAVGDQDKTDDPDADGRSNLLEFALDGNPAIGGANSKERIAVSTISGSDYLTLTVPMRVGASFSGPGDLVSAAVDKVIYSVQGSTDLSDFTSTGVTEVTPALSSGMTPPSTGWEYRTFRLTNPLTGNPKGFLRINAVAAP